MPAAITARSAWAGRAVIGLGWALFEGIAGDNHAHHHPALQLVLGVAGSVRVKLGERQIDGAGVLIGSNVQHALDPGPVRLLYVERESNWGRQLAAACVDGIRQLTREECHAAQQRWERPDADDVRVAAMIEGIAPAPTFERGVTASKQRVRAVIGKLHSRRPDSWTLAALVDEAALSPSRFAHAFKVETGMAVRPYLRWMRLARALAAVSAGCSLTDAAHEAGFADAAHFSRTMRRHFGITPGRIQASLQALGTP